MRRKLAIMFLVVAALTQAAIGVTAAGNAADEELTDGEVRETNALAQLFVKRMAETNDVAVVIDELFFPDFLDRHLNGPESEPFIFIQPVMARRLTRDEVRSYYVANVNFRHLSDLYLYSRFPVGGLPEMGIAYPPAIARLANRIDSDFVKLERAADAERLDEALAHLRSGLGLLEQANALLRAEIKRHKPAQSELYKKAVADWDERFQLYKPWPSVCEEGCYGLPAGSRLFIVNVPSFQLKVALAAGGVKIVSAMPYFD